MAKNNQWHVKQLDTKPSSTLIPNSPTLSSIRKTKFEEFLNSNGQLVGLNLFRVLAVFLMIVAHSARIQSNFNQLLNNNQETGILEHALLLVIQIEPIISAMFLFIAGFSLTLSLQNKIQHSACTIKHTKIQWLKTITIKAGMLYCISVLFFASEHGFQWPEICVSSGILSVIALGLLLTALLLATPKSIITLSVSTICVLAITYGLELKQMSIAGINAGPGGIAPLITLCFLGASLGRLADIYQQQGIFAAVIVTIGVSGLCSATSYPWTFEYQSQYTYYSPDIIHNSLYSFADLFGIKGAERFYYTATYWNHSSLYPLRSIGILTLILTFFIFYLRIANTPLLIYGNFLGQHALTLYVFHLICLSFIEVSDIKPTSSGQTWLLILLILLASGPAIKLRKKLALIFMEHYGNRLEKRS